MRKQINILLENIDPVGKFDKLTEYKVFTVNYLTKNQYDKP